MSDSSAIPTTGSASTTLAAIRTGVATTIVGKQEAIDLMLVALLCGSHALLEDVPGVGKTMMARALAAVTGCSFGRVQFTPDVLPSDITGSSIFNQQTVTFDFRAGPVFTHILLADEINRATPRTQSALLEAMEEQQVTVDGETRILPQPFFVIATQNPIDLEGTFPLPEAQLDRFMLRIAPGYPTKEEEGAILQRFEASNPLDTLRGVASPEIIMELRRERAKIEVSAVVRDYLLDVIRATREDDRILLGASPRAALALLKGTQAWALLNGRSYALPDDVKALAVPVLAHRIVLTAQARLRSLTQQEAIASTLTRIEVPVEEEPAATTDTPVQV